MILPFMPALLLTTLLSAAPAEAGRFGYDEVVVFVDADRAAAPVIARRMAYVNEIGRFYNSRGRFDRYFTLTVIPISSQTRSAAPLFRARRNPINQEGTFRIAPVHRRYTQMAAATHDRDLLGTVAVLRNMVTVRPEARILAIYVSDMIHVTPEIDTSYRSTGEMDYDRFKDEYARLVGPAGALSRGGAHVDVLIRTLGQTRTADPKIADFWGETILRRHLGTRRVTHAESYTLTELLVGER